MINIDFNINTNIITVSLSGDVVSTDIYKCIIQFQQNKQIKDSVLLEIHKKTYKL